VNRTTDEEAYRAERLARIEPIHRMTRGDASLATSARVQIDFESVLLSRSRRSHRQERPVVFATVPASFVVEEGEPLDRRELSLGRKRCVDVQEWQAARLRTRWATGRGYDARLVFAERAFLRICRDRLAPRQGHAFASARLGKSFVKKRRRM
jgi:hypothetical protein